MSAPVLDTNRSFGTRREMGGPQTIFQDGNLFDLQHEYLGPDPLYQPPPEIEEPEPEPSNGALTRARNNLEGFAPPAEVSDTKREDARARAAERLAE